MPRLPLPQEVGKSLVRVESLQWDKEPRTSPPRSGSKRNRGQAGRVQPTDAGGDAVFSDDLPLWPQEDPGAGMGFCGDEAVLRGNGLQSADFLGWRVEDRRAEGGSPLHCSVQSLKIYSTIGY